MGTRTLAKLFVALVGLLAVAITAGFAVSLDIPQLETLLLSATFAVLMALATARPVHFGFRANVDLTTLLIFAVALTFEPGLAVVTTAVGAVIGHLLHRESWSGFVFNSGQVILQTATAAGILAIFGWDAANPAYDEARYLPVLVLVMLSIFLINTTLVAIIIGLQARISAWSVWREALTSDLLVEQASQFALGLVTALVVHVQVWILPILLAPGLMLYISANRKSHLEFQTLDAINALADLVDRRDPYTADHSRRVAIVARELATWLGLPPHDIEVVERAARVHDLGKLVIDLSVLNKEGPLTEDEWELFRRHPEDGANILTWFSEFRESTEDVRYHHERWDGGGYPSGIAGEAIPIGARILAVADSLDAMSSARPYRPALSTEVIIEEFRKYGGRQWDPDVVAALLELIDSGTIDLLADGDAPQVYDGLGTVVRSR